MNPVQFYNAGSIKKTHPVLQRVITYAISQSITTPARRLLMKLNDYTYNLTKTGGVLATTTPITATSFSLNDVFYNFVYNQASPDLLLFAAIDWIRLDRATRTVDTIVLNTTGIASIEFPVSSGTFGFMDTNFNPSPSGSHKYSDNDANVTVNMFAQGTPSPFFKLSNQTQRTFIGSSPTARLNTTGTTTFTNLNITGTRQITRSDAVNIIMRSGINNGTTVSESLGLTGAVAVSNGNFFLFRSASTNYTGVLQGAFIGKFCDSTTFDNYRKYTNKYLLSIGLTATA